MEMDERLELKKKYASLPDEEIIGMLREGKDSYVDGAYELLLSEAEERGIEEKIEQAQHMEDPSVSGETETAPETFVQIIIVNDEADLMFLKSALESADINHFFQDLSLKGDSLPVSLMVAEAQVDRVKGLLKGFKPVGSIILW